MQIYGPAFKQFFVDRSLISTMKHFNNVFVAFSSRLTNEIIYYKSLPCNNQEEKIHSGGRGKFKRKNRRQWSGIKIKRIVINIIANFLRKDDLELETSCLTFSKWFTVIQCKWSRLISSSYSKINKKLICTLKVFKNINYH